MKDGIYLLFHLLTTIAKLIQPGGSRPVIAENLLERVAKANGFSLHAGVSCEGQQKEKVRAHRARETALGHKRERLCR